jgi:hypothetical protein
MRFWHISIALVTNLTPCRYFFMLLVGAVALLSVQVAVCIYIIVQYGVNRTDLEGDLHSSLPNLSAPALFGLAIGILSFILVCYIMVLQLLFFHVLLIIRDITTYDYIMMKQRQYAGLPTIGAPPGGGARTSLCFGQGDAPQQAAQQQQQAAQVAPEQDSHYTFNAAAPEPAVGAAAVTSQGVVAAPSDKEGTSARAVQVQVNSNIAPVLAGQSEREISDTEEDMQHGSTQFRRIVPEVSLTDDLPQSDAAHLEAYATEINPSGHLTVDHSAAASRRGSASSSKHEDETKDAAYDARNSRQTEL